MRLIDADALIPLIQEDKIEGKTLDIIKELGDGLQAETLNQACDRHIKIISNLPTIEPKRGEWIEDKYTRKCSICGSHFWMRAGNVWKYCPNCGSKNGGENGDD